MSIEQLKVGIYVGRFLSWVKGLFKKTPLPQQQVSDSTNVLSVSGNQGSTINIGNLSAESRGSRVHSNLAKPKPTIQETGFSSHSGYTFTMKNLGGEVLTVEVRANDKTVDSLAQLPRGGSYSFKVHNLSRTEVLPINIDGFDLNGDRVALFYTATHLAGNFKFDNA